VKRGKRAPRVASTQSSPPPTIREFVGSDDCACQILFNAFEIRPSTTLAGMYSVIAISIGACHESRQRSDALHCQFLREICDLVEHRQSRRRPNLSVCKYLNLFVVPKGRTPGCSIMACFLGAFYLPQNFGSLPRRTIYTARTIRIIL
jgi:hypothetical protein